MKRFKSTALVALAVFVAVSTFVTLAPRASAQSSSLSIAPKKTYVIEPGKSVEDTLVIRNIDQAHELTLFLQVIDFTYTDDSGTPKLMLDTTLDPTPWSLRGSLKVPDSVTVPAGGSRSITMKVTMPKNIGGGSYYSAIMYSTTAPSGGNVGLAASGVTLAFVTVPGAANENLSIKKLGAYDAQARVYKYFALDEPKTIAYTLLNEGNIAESPVGNINVQDMFGHKYAINNVNPSSSLALIGQTRTFQACIKLASQKVDFNGSKTDQNTCVSPGLWPGLYTVTADLFYGQNGNLTKEINKTAYFWYLPLWFIIVLIIALLAAAYYIWRTIVWMRGGTFRIGVGARGPRKSRRRHH